MFRASQERFVYRNELGGKAFGAVGFCDAETFLHNGQIVVVFTEIPSNPGPSVTNAIECIIAQFCKLKDLIPNETVFIERYDSHPNDLDLVTLVNELGEEKPRWQRLSEEESAPILLALNS